MLTRPPAEVGAILRAKAKELDVPYGDYLSAILCEYVGLNHLMPMPLPKHPQQEFELPMSA
jgi:hypothetical protein